MTSTRHLSVVHFTDVIGFYFQFSFEGRGAHVVHSLLDQSCVGGHRSTDPSGGSKAHSWLDIVSDVVAGGPMRRPIQGCEITGMEATALSLYRCGVRHGRDGL